MGPKLAEDMVMEDIEVEVNRRWRIRVEGRQYD
jgi:hypothetical protein